MQSLGEKKSDSIMGNTCQNSHHQKEAPSPLLLVTKDSYVCMWHYLHWKIIVEGDEKVLTTVTYKYKQ